MAIETGIPPRSLLNTPDDIFDAMVDEFTRRLECGWTTNELAASTIQTIDNLYRLLFRANTAKGVTQPRPLKIRRPWEPEPVKRKATLREFAAALTERARNGR